MSVVIGITGSIGSGKSSVARMMRKFGAAVIDTDKLAHAVYKPGTEAFNDLVFAFGKNILSPSGKIDRNALAAIVFQDISALKKLNEITHPPTLELVCKLLNKYVRKNVPVIVIEAPLLIDAGWKGLADEIWVVAAGKPAIKQRLHKQRRLTEAEVASRMKGRFSQMRLIKYADIVINNDGSKEALQEQVTRQWKRLLTGRT
jgi:dephospho-CoA kinase